MPNELKKITALPSGTPADTDVVPFVDLATNTTKKALKSELKGDKGDAATVDAGTTTTLAAGQSATVTNVGTPSAAIFNFAIPQGIQGIPGLDGASIVSVSFVGNDIVFVLDDTSTVTLTNAKTDLKGDQGDIGAKIVGASFVGDDLVFVLDDSSTVTVTDAKTTLKGDQGIQGIQGVPGNDGADGISFIWKGAYVAETTYQVNDVVSYNGSTYICVLESTGNLPTNTTYWSLMAQKGTDGTGSGDISGSGTANELAYFTAEKTIDNLPVATYPSLTEVSYVKGVTSAIQTQLNGKQASGSYEVTTNKETSALDTSTTKYPCNNVVKTAVDAKIGNVVEDTTPQLGGQLDVNGNALGDGTNELLKFSETASAVNEITIKNNSTGNAPEIQATGDDTNIDLVLKPKGTGIVKGETHTATFVLKGADTDLATDTSIGGDFRIPGNRAITIKKVGAYVDTAGTTGVTTIDINEGGTSILSTKITIDSGEKSSQTAATAPVISDASIAADAILTFDIDSISTTAPKGLKVYVEFTYA